MLSYFSIHRVWDSFAELEGRRQGGDPTALQTRRDTMSSKKPPGNKVQTGFLDAVQSSFWNANDEIFNGGISIIN